MAGPTMASDPLLGSLTWEEGNTKCFHILSCHLEVTASYGILPVQASASLRSKSEGTESTSSEKKCLIANHVG